MLRRNVSVFGRAVPAVVVVVVVIVAALAGVVVAVLARGREAERPLARVTIEVGDSPQSIAAGALGVWVVEAGD